MQDEQLSQGKSLSEIYRKQLDMMKNPQNYKSIIDNLPENEKKAMADPKIMAELEKLVAGKQTNFNNILLGIKEPKTVITKTTSTKKK